MQLPLYGNLVKGIITLRANRQAAIIIITIIIIIIIKIITKITTTAILLLLPTTTTTMKMHLQLQKDKIQDPRKPVLPEVLQNNLKKGNKSSNNLNNSRLTEKSVRRFKFPVNSKLQSLYPLDPRSRQQILLSLSLFLFLFLFLFRFRFLLLLLLVFTTPPHINTKTEIVKLFPKIKIKIKINPNLTKIFHPPPHDQLVAKIMIPSDLPPLRLVQPLHW